MEKFIGRGYLIKSDKEMEYHTFFEGTRKEAQEYVDKINKLFNEKYYIDGTSLAIYKDVGNVQF